MDRIANGWRIAKTSWSVLRHDRELIVVLVLATVLATWVSAIGSAAVVAGAAERMAGGEPTLGSAFATARARAVRLLEWAVLATVVSIILDQLEQRLGFL